MSETVIKINNLGKMYHIGETLKHDTFRDLAADLFARHVLRGERAADRAAQTIWALKDFSFEVKKGDVVGIIGRNGAGKSTLLKILSRITEPTEGRVEMFGRVGSLLEVGTGFHPELTGRENIYLNGAILGMSKNEIHKRFDEIVAFSEIEKFLDTPVKRYSSGMYVRLAFAVAAHMNPEVLIVDEVLAVGDAQFQKKCIGKMGEVALGGRTVLFVSHNMATIRQLCTRGVLLKDGKIAMIGSAEQAVNAYISDGMKMSEGCKRWDVPADASKKVWPVSVEMRDDAGRVVTDCGFDQPVTLWLTVRVYQPVSFQISYNVVNAQEVPVFSTEAGLETRSYDKGLYQFACRIPSSFLAPGHYRVCLGIHKPNVEIFFSDQSALGWTVEETGSSMARYAGNQYGVVVVDIKWDISKVE